MGPVTIKDVAARAGVAISSVSTALNGGSGVSEATRAKIVAAADELGYVPSMRGRSLSGKRTYAVGLVVNRTPDVLEFDPFFGAFIGGIEAAIDTRGYALVLQISPDPGDLHERYRRLAIGQRVDGVFLNELVLADARVDLVRELGLPAVAINAPDGFPVPTVRQDHRPGIEALIEHLLGLGHTRIGFIGGPARFVHSQERESAWRETLLRRGLTPGPVHEGGFTYEGGAQAARAMLPDPPTAVVCANDLSAMGCIAEFAHAGLSVPGDVSVTGYDGIQLGEYLRPALTTVQTTPSEIGFQAARTLLDVIENGSAEDVVVDPARFVPRGSTGPVA